MKFVVRPLGIAVHEQPFVCRKVHEGHKQIDLMIGFVGAVVSAKRKRTLRSFAFDEVFLPGSTVFCTPAGTRDLRPNPWSDTSLRYPAFSIHPAALPRRRLSFRWGFLIDVVVRNP